MRGMVFLGDRRVEVRDFPDPTPGPGEAVVKIRAAGLCGSDLGLYRGERAATWVCGHEPCGEVVALGPGVTAPALGDRVIAYHYAGCGVCRHCRAGWEQLCLRGGHRVCGFGADGANCVGSYPCAPFALPSGKRGAGHLESAPYAPIRHGAGSRRAAMWVSPARAPGAVGRGQDSSRWGSQQRGDFGRGTTRMDL